MSIQRSKMAVRIAYRLDKSPILARTLNDSTAVVDAIVGFLSFRDQLAGRAECFLRRALFSRHCLGRNCQAAIIGKGIRSIEKRSQGDTRVQSSRFHRAEESLRWS